MSQEQKEIKYSSYRILNVKVDPECENKNELEIYGTDCRNVICDKFLDMMGKEYKKGTGCGGTFTIERINGAYLTEDEIKKIIQTIKDLSYKQGQCLSYKFFKEQYFTEVNSDVYTRVFTRVCQCDTVYTKSNKISKKDHKLALKVVDILFEIAEKEEGTLCYRVVKKLGLNKIQSMQMLDLPYLKRCLTYSKQSKSLDGPVTKKRKIEEN